jgi:DNA repair protein RadD
MLDLRDYQDRGVNDIRAAFRLFRLVLYILSTGGGKTVVFTYIVMRTISSGRRVVIVAHRREIVGQISRTLDKWGVKHGIIAPGHSLTDDLVQVAMVQSLANCIRKGRIAEPDLVIVDEAHHSPAGSWRSISDAWQRARFLGVTATLERLDGKGLSDCYETMVLGPTMKELIDAGHLAQYNYLAPPSSLDLSGIKTRHGDYAIDELEKKMIASMILGDIVGHYREFLGDRPAIAFCVTVKHAEMVAEEFRQSGIKAAVIHCAMSAKERKTLIESLADGRLQVLANCSLISEGVDIPVCSGVIMLRPTKSLSLWLQMVGRILRPKPDGSRAIILDHVGNVYRFGMPDLERDWSLEGRKSRKEKPPEITTCDLCFKSFPRAQARAMTENCGGVRGEICPFQAEARPGKPLPDRVDGKLEIVTNIRPQDDGRPAWAGGMPLADIQGPALHRAIYLADTDKEKLQQIARARGYRRGWVQHKLREAAEAKAGVQAILESDEPDLGTPSDHVLWRLVRVIEDAEKSDCPETWLDLRILARRELHRRRNSNNAAGVSVHDGNRAHA